MDDLPYLVYFYGELNTNSMYGFVSKSNFVPFEEAKTKKDYYPAFVKSKSKLDENKKLTKLDEQNLRVLEAMETDLILDRSVRRIIDFPEEYDLLTPADILSLDGLDSDSDSDSEGESSELTDSSKPQSNGASTPAIVKKKLGRPKGGKNKPKVGNKSKDEGLKTDTIIEDQSKGSSDDPRAALVYSFDEDEANIKYAMEESDDEDDDDDDEGWDAKGTTSKPDLTDMDLDDTIYTDNVDRKKKKGKLNAMQPSKRQRQNLKKELNPEAREKRDFMRCEKLYLPFVEKWEIAYQKRDLTNLKECFDQASSVVVDCSAPFLEAYFPSLVKKTKAFFRDSSDGSSDELLKAVKTVGKMLGEAYKEKLKMVPIGFKAPKAKIIPIIPVIGGNKGEPPIQEVKRSGDAAGDGRAVTVKRTDLKEVNESGSRPHSPMRPSMDDTTKQRFIPLDTHENNALKLESSKPDAPVASKPWKSFSLGKLKTRVESQQPLTMKAHTAAPKLATIPSWMVTPITADPVNDPDRRMAMDFLKEMSTHFPSDRVNGDAIAQLIEKAIFSWASRVAASMGEFIEPQEGKDSWVDFYWIRVHAIVAAVCGSKGNGTGTLVHLMMNGEFTSPDAVVALSEEKLQKAFHGLAI